MTSTPVVLVHLPGQTRELMDALGREALACKFVPCDAEEDVRKHIADAEVLISTPIFVESSSAGTLRWIQSLFAGADGWLDSVPPTVPITRMAGVFERYMAEYVFAHLLHNSQKLAELARAQSDRSWATVTTESLHGQTIGVAGIGFVGREVARLAKAFGMTIKCLGRRKRVADELKAACGSYFDQSRLNEFLAGLNVLVLTLPATPETDRMFGAREFKAMPRGAVVINIARGQLLDEGALLDALRDGHLSRAIIDTFRHEPLPADSPLWDVPNITVTPHMAGAIHPKELGPVVAKNIRSYLSGRIPSPIVDRRVGY